MHFEHFTLSKINECFFSCRHPEATQRPTFTQLCTSLHQQDDVLLDWSEDERASYSENARTIGATPQGGEILHSALHNAYIV